MGKRSVINAVFTVHTQKKNVRTAKASRTVL